MQINGKNLAVDVDGEGPAVLLVHGLGGTTSFYQSLSDHLSANNQVIRVDNAGAGRSETTQEISVVQHAEDLAAVLEGLGVDSAVVVGHSMGTLVVRELAARHPEMVNKLVLLGAVRTPTPEGKKGQRDRAALVRDEGMAPVASAVVANALSERTRTEQPAVAALVRELLIRQDPEGYARNCEALASANDPGPVTHDLPLLLITGEDDKVGPPDASHELAGGHPAAHVEILPQVGHWTAVEAITEVNRIIADFA